MKICKQKICGIVFTCFSIWIFSFYLVNLAVAAEYCVNTSADLQSALTDAETNDEDDIIKLRQGTYYGNFTYSSTEAFSLTIEGGYNHPRCKKRVVDPANTVLDAEYSGRVLTLDCSIADADLVVDGITLQNGNGDLDVNGGGLFAATDGSVTLTDNSINYNSTISYGGGIYFYSSGSVTLTNNTISDNSANLNGGGGFFNTSSGLITLTNNTIYNNNSYTGGGIFFQSSYSGSAALTNNTIHNNSAYDSGGGYFNTSSGTVTLTNNTISDNSVSTHGGGAYFYIWSGTVTLTNNTISDNIANLGGGGAYILLIYDDAIINIYNNIVWNNGAGEGGDLHIRNDANDNSVTSTVNLYNNDFNHTQTSGIYIQIPFTIDSSNINAVPQFDIDGYHLTDISPCIDAGVDAGVYDDIDGDSRPHGLGYDIGADEFVGTSEMLDLDIARFTATKRVSLNSNKNTVEISLAVVNNGTLDAPCPATVVGLQNSDVVHSETIDISDAIGKGPTSFNFLPYLPTVDGDIMWTVSVDDDDPDVDEATAYTSVNP